MQITYQALIKKMESELKKAKEAQNHDRMRGHLFALKALADLLLETGEYIPESQPQFIKRDENKDWALKESSSSVVKSHVDDDGDDSIFDF